MHEFITDLYRLVEHCKYGDLQDELVRNRIVVGIRDSELSEKPVVSPGGCMHVGSFAPSLCTCAPILCMCSSVAYLATCIAYHSMHVSLNALVTTSNVMCYVL